MNVKQKARKSKLRIYRRPYPNAADPGYFMNKLVDVVLSVVSTMGIITLFFFLATM